MHDATNAPRFALARREATVPYQATNRWSSWGPRSARWGTRATATLGEGGEAGTAGRSLEAAPVPAMAAGVAGHQLEAAPVPLPGPPRGAAARPMPLHRKCRRRLRERDRPRLTGLNREANHPLPGTLPEKEFPLRPTAPPGPLLIAVQDTSTVAHARCEGRRLMIMDARRPNLRVPTPPQRRLEGWGRT